MDKKIAGLLGAAAALATMNGAQAAAPASATGLAPAANYADLLQPVPNALGLLKADDARLAQAPGTGVQLAQYHHHHHHHRRHHHHHHHHGY